MRPAEQPVSHSKYLGSSNSQGYPTGDEYAQPVSRLIYGSYPLASRLSESGDYDRRVVTSKVALVPDTSVYFVRDKVVLPGTEPEDSRTYFIAEDIRDYSEGPFGRRPSVEATTFGEIVLEKVSG